jgi:sialate O-acetylesterase
MEMGVGMALNPKEEIAAANYPKIRLLSIPRVVSNVPQPHTNASWKVCSPETIAQAGWGGFSATAYYFGRALHQSLNVPVGLINSSWGGTRIEPWTPPEGFATEPALKSIYDGSQLADPRTPQHQQRLADYLTSIDAWSAAARSAMTKQEIVPTMPAYPKELAKLTESKPAALYNGMINPLVPMTMRGCIWYQGEANHTEGMLYLDKTRALVNGWRKTFQQDDLAYYYVQIAPYQYGDEDATILAKFWEAQAAAMTIPNTGMVVTTDIGNVTDIHPTNKQEVGRRLALWALAKTYHKTGTVFSGPVFKSMETSGKQLRLTFDHVGGGLVSRDDKPLNSFEIIDGDTGTAVPATATIDGNTVVLTAATVNKPVGMRFAWSKLAEPNLSNKDGLPALPFRAGKNPN